MIADRHPMARTLPALILLTCLLAACGPSQLGFPGAPEALGPEAMFERGLVLAAEEAWGASDAVLRRVASRCDSGEHGRRALLLLAALWVDPRNRHAHPDSAALLAARFLALPDAEAVERLLAETFYLTAIDRGADPYLRSDPVRSPGGIALRFSDCGAAAAEPPVHAPLPVLEREPLAAVVRRLEEERDSLVSRAERASETTRDLESRLRQLEAELARIRRLLGGGRDTTSISRP